MALRFTCMNWIFLKKPLFRRRGVRVLFRVLVYNGLLFFGLRSYEHAVTFHPEPFNANLPTQAPQPGEEAWITTRDGVHLYGWLFRAQTKSARGAILFCHGNGGNIQNVRWVGEKMSARGFDVLLFDYRQYGRSEGSLGDENDIYADADAACRYLVEKEKVLPDQLVLYGQSLGTTAVVDLASRTPCRALIIESGLSSESNLALTVAPWLPHWLHWIGKNRFESARKLKNVHCPVLISHGDSDEIVPVNHARDLYAAANEPKKLMIFPGVGHNVFGEEGDAYFDQLASFILAH